MFKVPAPLPRAKRNVGDTHAIEESSLKRARQVHSSGSAHVQDVCKNVARVIFNRPEAVRVIVEPLLVDHLAIAVNANRTKIVCDCVLVPLLIGLLEQDCDWSSCDKRAVFDLAERADDRARPADWSPLEVGFQQEARSMENHSIGIVGRLIASPGLLLQPELNRDRAHSRLPAAWESTGEWQSSNGLIQNDGCRWLAVHSTARDRSGWKRIRVGQGSKGSRSESTHSTDERQGERACAAD